MDYKKRTWGDGDTITAAALNNLEEGVAQALEMAEDVVTDKELDAAVDDALAEAKESGDFKGDPGAPGAPGVSVTHEWNGTVLTITSASGKSSADLKGEPGEPGYTPQNGKDYNTESEKRDMVNRVLSALPTWEGGSY